MEFKLDLPMIGMILGGLSPIIIIGTVIAINELSKPKLGKESGHPPVAKIFDGKRYILSFHRGAIPTKAKADQLAGYEKEKGQHVRIVKWEDRYWIYVRPIAKRLARILDKTNPGNPESSDIYERNYTALKKIIPDIDDLKPGMSAVSKSGGFMDLHLDVLSKTPTETRIALHHSFEVAGDLVSDPDMEIRIFPKRNMVEALTYQDQFGYRVVYPGPGKVNLKAKRELNSFLATWLTNLRRQGHRITKAKLKGNPTIPSNLGNPSKTRNLSNPRNPSGYEKAYREWVKARKTMEKAGRIEPPRKGYRHAFATDVAIKAKKVTKKKWREDITRMDRPGIDVPTIAKAVEERAYRRWVKARKAMERAKKVKPPKKGYRHAFATDIAIQAKKVAKKKWRKDIRRGDVPGVDIPRIVKPPKVKPSKVKPPKVKPPKVKPPKVEPVPGKPPGMSGLLWGHLTRLAEKLGVADLDWPSEVDPTLEYGEIKAHLIDVYGKPVPVTKVEIEEEEAEMEAAAERGLEGLIDEVREKLKAGYSLMIEEPEKTIMVEAA